VSIFADRVLIRHTRLEQNCPEGLPEHFMVRWSLTMTFDAPVRQLRSTRLRVENVTFSPAMDAATIERFHSVVPVPEEGMIIA
jgi:hypothetical protein